MLTTKYIPNDSNDVLQKTIQLQISSKVRRNVYLLILFTLIILYIFLDELSCNKDALRACLNDNNYFENVDETNENINLPITVNKPFQEKFITYLPHSGFHNQRIAFENALFLAWSLNRTLILPPAILGKRFGYKEFDLLQEKLISLKSNKSNLEQDCENEILFSKSKSVTECIDFHQSYMLTTWNHLFDLSFIENNIKIIYNHNMNISKIINDQLKIKDYENDVFYDKFYPGNHAFFENSIPREKIDPISDGRILKYYILKDLKNQPQKLLVFGSLFGPGTVIRQSEESRIFFSYLKYSIIPRNEIMKNVVKNISNKLGGTFNYLTFHGRAGDGHYKIFADKHIANVMNNIKRDMPNFNNVNITLYQNLTEFERHKLCYKNIIVGPKKREFSRLTRIYIASDVQKSSPPLQVIFNTFPCAYIMSDFEEDLEPLKEIYNNIDNQNMFKFILPLVDLMIGSNARKVYTMSTSTFAGYMLRYHFIIENELSSKQNEKTYLERRTRI